MQRDHAANPLRALHYSNYQSIEYVCKCNSNTLAIHRPAIVPQKQDETTWDHLHACNHDPLFWNCGVDSEKDNRRALPCENLLVMSSGVL